MAWAMDYSRKKLIKPHSLKGVDPSKFTLAELEKQYGHLSTAITLTELCSFLEVKFADYRASGVAIASYLLALVGMIFVVVLLLAFANLALYRADHTMFAINGPHNVFDFVYYSFGAVTGQRSGEIIPVSVAAKSLSMFATALGWIFVAGTGLSLFLSVKRDQDDASINAAIARLQAERERMNQFVEQGFSLNLDDAIKVLEGLQGGLAKFVSVLRTARGE